MAKTPTCRPLNAYTAIASPMNAYMLPTCRPHVRTSNKKRLHVAHMSPTCRPHLTLSRMPTRRLHVAHLVERLHVAHITPTSYSSRISCTRCLMCYVAQILLLLQFMYQVSHLLVGRDFMCLELVAIHVPGVPSACRDISCV